MTNNASVMFDTTYLGRDEDDPLQVVVSTDRDERERRCMLTRTSMGEEALAIGQASTDMWRLRVSSKGVTEPITKQTIAVRQDGSSDWHEYTIVRVALRMCWDLLLRRTVD